MKVIVRTMIENYLLEQLLTFNEEKSLSKAARKLNISQPALSKSMKKLEKTIGVTLFNRTSNSIKLNDAGQVAVKYAKRAIKSNQAIIENTRAFAQQHSEFHLGVCSNFVEMRLNSLISSCYPSAQLTYKRRPNPHLLTGLKNEDYDLIVVSSEVKDKDLYSQHYFDERLMLTILKTDLLAQKKEIHFSNLNGMSILAEQGADFWLDIVKKNIPNLNLLVQTGIPSLDKLVKESKLPVFNSTEAIKKFPDPANKISIPIMDSTAKVSYYIVCRKEDKQIFDKVFNKISAN